MYVKHEKYIWYTLLDMKKNQHYLMYITKQDIGGGEVIYTHTHTQFLVVVLISSQCFYFQLF